MSQIRLVFIAVLLFFSGIRLEIYKKILSCHLEYRLQKNKPLSDKFSMFLSRKIKFLTRKWQKHENFFKKK